MERPLLFQLAYPFLIFVLFALILSLPFAGNLGNIFEVAAALLFGIFGLKQLIAPTSSQGNSLLDIVFLGLYVVLAFMIIMLIIARLVRAFRQKQPEPSG